VKLTPDVDGKHGGYFMHLRVIVTIPVVEPQGLHVVDVQFDQIPSVNNNECNSNHIMFCWFV